MVSATRTAATSRTLHVTSTSQRRTDDTLLGAVININDVERVDEPDQIGVGLFPVYSDQDQPQRVLWTIASPKELFNPGASLFDSKLDTIPHAGLILWALAAYQSGHGIQPDLIDHGLAVHTVQPPSPLVNNN